MAHKEVMDWNKVKNLHLCKTVNDLYIACAKVSRGEEFEELFFSILSSYWWLYHSSNDYTVRKLCSKKLKLKTKCLQFTCVNRKNSKEAVVKHIFAKSKDEGKRILKRIHPDLCENYFILNTTSAVFLEELYLNVKNLKVRSKQNRPKKVIADLYTDIFLIGKIWVNLDNWFCTIKDSPVESWASSDVLSWIYDTLNYGQGAIKMCHIRNQISDALFVPVEITKRKLCG